MRCLLSTCRFVIQPDYRTYRLYCMWIFSWNHVAWNNQYFLKNFSNRFDFEPARYPLPQAESARLDHITLPNWVLLGGADSAHRIAMALRDLAAQPHKVLAARQAPTADAF